ncbi:MAG: GNAT family N-acetyltransferase [Geobacteraceae bacterium]|nr:GNAT family N-acetyltransferase [Geobacteraceae bacterium]
MSDFSLNRYRTDARIAWDDVVRNSKNGNFLHVRDYMDYHSHRFDEQSLIVEKKGNPVAVFPCNKVEDRVVSHGGLTYGGLIYGNDIHAADVLEIFRLIADHYRAIGCTLLMYKAIPHIFHRYPAEEDLYALFCMGARLVRRDISSVIPMGIRLKLSDSRKNTIRKSIKKGVEIREGEFFDAYRALLSDVLLKFGSQPVHTSEELRLLKSRFPSHIRLFGAFKGDRLLAGTLVYDFGHVAHTQYLASSDEGRGIGALDYVLAHLLDNIFADRQYFSFGISTEQNGQYLNKGLIFQKEGFGGRGIAHDHYELEL